MQSSKKTSGGQTVAESTDTGRGGSIVQALAILRHLSSTGQSIGVTAIAKQLKLSPSSCFNILKTLVGQDLVEFSQIGKTYSIGFGLLHIVRESLNHNRVLPLLAPGMRKLADKFHTAVGLWRISRIERPLLVWLAETEGSIRIHLTMGQRLPLLAGSVGRCVAAHRVYPPAEFARLFSKLRLAQPISVEEYEREIALARKRGFAVDAGVYMQGVTSISAPVVGDDGELAFCLSATMFLGQHPKRQLPVIGEELRALAQRAPLISGAVKSS
jgi:DNA-binding IclR family transcriptional regulator